MLFFHDFYHFINVYQLILKPKVTFWSGPWTCLSDFLSLSVMSFGSWLSFSLVMTLCGIWAYTLLLLVFAWSWFPWIFRGRPSSGGSLPPRSSLLCSVHAGCTGEATCRPWSPGPVPTPVFSCPLSPFLCYPCLAQVLIPVSGVSPVWAPVLAGKPGGGGPFPEFTGCFSLSRSPRPRPLPNGQSSPRFSPWPQAAHLLSRDPAGWFGVSSPQLLCCLPSLCLTVKIRQLSGLSAAVPTSLCLGVLVEISSRSFFESAACGS